MCTRKKRLVTLTYGPPCSTPTWPENTCGPLVEQEPKREELRDLA